MDRPLKTLKSITDRAPRPLIPSAALKLLTAKSGIGVYASADTLFKDAIFGRDSLEVAEDLMLVKRRLVRRIILAMVALQGTTTNPNNEEEPGKIIHEYRSAVIDGRPIKDESRKIFDRLSAIWGGDENSLAYYGSIDSTPLFIKVVGQYVQTWDEDILMEEVVARDGEVITVGESLHRALLWLLDSLKKSGSGLLEFKRQNPHGIANQSWKDSEEFYIHSNGKLANHDRPIASIEVQALAYDALMTAADLFDQSSLKSDAAKIRDRTIELLWWPDRNYFALGTDYDQHGKLRAIKTMTANPAQLLDNGFFDGLAAASKQKYVSAIAREIMGTEFLTDAGIRSRGLSDARLVDFWDYHGSYTTWPKETYDIAKGLHRQGFPRLAVQLENRLLNVVKATHAYPEFIYVDARGRALGMASSASTHGELVFVDSSNRPEKIQAWTVSAIMAITARRRPFKSPRPIVQKLWQTQLEKEILSHIPLTKRLRTTREIAARYPVYPTALNGEKRP